MAGPFSNTNPLFRPFLDAPETAPAGLASTIAMPSAAPALPAAIAPVVSKAPSLSDTARANYADVANKPDTISGIHNPLLRGIARAGDIAASVFAPRVAQFIPGTTLNHEREVGIAASRAKTAEAQDQAEANVADTQAGTQQKKALADYTAQRPEIEESKIEQKQQAIRQRIQQQAAARGQTVAFDQEGVPTFEDNPDLQAYHTAAAAALLHTANAEKATIEAEIKKNGYVPGTPEYERAMKQIAQRDAQIAIAGGNLAQRRADFGVKAYGVGPDGQELPGALHDESGATVGTAMQHNVAPTTTERDAAGRANTLTALQGRIQEQLNDPEIQKYMGPMGGRLAEAQSKLGTLPAKVAQFQNDLVSYGAFQAGLHPVRGIGALQYFDRVMGGLHQTPEQLLGKLRSNSATAAAVQQTGEMPTKAGNQRKATAPNGPSIPSAGPKAGEVVDGYRFKGGNPADQKNWEKQ